MKKIKQLNVLFIGVLIFSPHIVFGAEGQLSKKVVPPDYEDEYEYAKLSIPPDLESAYEESLFWRAEEEAVEGVSTAKPKEEDGKEPDKVLQDLKRRQLEEQQRNLQRMIAENTQR